MSKRVVLAGVILGISLVVLQSPTARADEPTFVDGRLVYPENGDIPRYLTPIEKQYLEEFGPFAPRGSDVPPSGPVHCVAEYEPMEGLLIAWEPWNSLIQTFLEQIGYHVTTTAASKLYVVVDSSTEATQASSALSAAGATMSRVQFVVRTTDTIWIRDYGPRYIYEGTCRAVVDHIYNRPRPNDDILPIYFAESVKHHALYNIPLIHGGGNFHLDALNRSYVTRLINNENPNYTEQQIYNLWLAFQNLSTTFFDPFPTSVDATQHIDMWMQVIADDKVVISDWPSNPGSVQDQICDNAATFMSTRGYTVYRTPARSVSGTHYTYTNVVMCNNIVLIPYYTNATVAPHNAQALAVWQSALPNKTIIQLDSQAIVPSAGVMHCIVMHVPAHLGGANPTAYLKNYRGGQTLQPGQQITINWISDDDVGVSNVDIRLSTNGGASYPTIIVAATPDDGAHTWTVPDIYTTQARIRVIARDTGGRLGFDSSDSDIIINGTPPVIAGDMNCDGALNSADVAPFALALTDPAAYGLAYPGCNLSRGDMNGDTLVDGSDVIGFIDALYP
ncbi:MAG: agmatine deiminase family protein [Phycisphaerae bacterium]|nr:agmatine deiminase family protein [Phycisphaerae bacterium]NUQ44682.1 agmatine deiminase family protein [Phycisphaerae bacterium]